MEQIDNIAFRKLLHNQGHVSFNTKEFIDAINLDKLPLVGKKITFSHCIFRSDLTIEGFKASGYDILFEDCTFEGVFQISNSEINNVTLASCKVTIILFSTSRINSINLFVLNTEFFVDELGRIGRVEMERFNPALDDAAEIKRGLAYRPKICISCRDSKILVRGLNKAYFDRFLIIQINDPFEDTHIEHLSCGQFELTGTNRKNSVSVKNVEARVFDIDSYYNFGTTSFFGIENPDSSSGRSTFRCVRSHLGKASFLNVNFSSYKTLDFSGASLVEVSFANCKWSTKKAPLTASKFKIDTSLIAYSDAHVGRREIFRQIKYAQSKGGDVLFEKLFYSLEMVEYLQTITWKSNFSTWVILILSKWTSNFGQSMGRPVMTILLTGIVIYPCYLCSLPSTKEGFDYCYSLIDYMISSQGISGLLYWIMPFHRFEYHPAVIPVVLDILMRAISSYSIYNFIRATRRFIG